MAAGTCSNVCLPGSGITPGILSWHLPGRELMAVVHWLLSTIHPHDSQCFVRLPFADLADRSARLADLMSSALYDRNGDEILSRGLFLNLPPWGYHVFEVKS